MRECEIDAAAGLSQPRHGSRITHYLSLSRVAGLFSLRRFANAWPVISRELRAEARNPLNYWFRLLGAGVVVAGFALIMIDQSGRAGQLGSRLFRELNSMLFFSIAVFVPMLTADCLSREKREGTLGLLFLTPLRARDIVIGKSLLHTVRAFTLLLAAMPVLLLPFVLGGVSGTQLGHAITSNLSALLLALAAGLLASVRNTEWIRSVVVAELLSGALILLWSFLNGFLVSVAIIFDHIIRHLQWLKSAATAQTAAPSLASLLNKLPIGIGLLAALLIFAWIIRRAVNHLERIWQEESATPPQPAWVKFFSTSNFWQAFFKWNESRTLDRNPIAWLQEYSWTARLTKWGWFGVVMVGELLMLFNYGFFFLWQLRLALVLALGMAFTSAWSFRRERQSGALELLLVTPLQATQLIRGRIWGLWAHFFPAVALLMFLWIFNPFHFSRLQFHVGMICFFTCAFLTLPLIGLYFSLMRWHFLVAWLSTATVGVLLPYFATSLVTQFSRRYWGPGMKAYWVVCLIQVGFAAWAYVRLRRNLTERSFSLERGGL